MNDILYILTLLGPLFAINGFLGEQRTKKVEKFILDNFITLLGIIKDFLIVIPIILFATSLILYTFIPSELSSIAYGLDESINLAARPILSLLFMAWLKWYKILFCSIVAIVLLVISIYSTGENSISTFFLYCISTILFWYGFIYGSHILVHLLFRHISSKWHIIDNANTPWPFSLGDREFHIGSINHYSIFSLFWMPYIILRLFLKVITLIVFLPFYVAELLRKRITPEKPVFMDLFAYMLSIISIIYLSIDKLSQ